MTPRRVPIELRSPPGPATLLADLLLPPALVVDAAAPVVEVAELLQQHATGAAVVRGAPARIVTEHDIVRALVAGAVERATLEVAHEAVAVSQEHSLLAAARLMVDQRIRHLLVVDASGEVRAVLPQGLALDLLLTGFDSVVWTAGTLRAASCPARAR